MKHWTFTLGVNRAAADNFKCEVGLIGFVIKDERGDMLYADCTRLANFQDSHTEFGHFIAYEMYTGIEYEPVAYILYRDTMELFFVANWYGPQPKTPADIDKFSWVNYERQPVVIVGGWPKGAGEERLAARKALSQQEKV